MAFAAGVRPTLRAFAVVALAAITTDHATPGLRAQAAHPSVAPTYKVLAAFNEIPKYPVGRLLEVSPGVFLGASGTGGAFFKGTVFVLYRKPNLAWSFATLHAFNGGDGSGPRAGLIRGRDGNFYGTTFLGGAADRGTVFRITPKGVLTTLHSFTQAEGDWPSSELVQTSDGTLWGAASSHGPDECGGIIFRLTEGGAFSTVQAFRPRQIGGVWLCPDGANPNRLILGDDGTIYGTSGGGGVYNTTNGVLGAAGVLFRLSPSSLSYSVLHTFVSDVAFPLGSYPADLLKTADGTLYGVARRSVEGGGVVFRLGGDGSYEVLHRFDFLNDDGYYPGSLIEASDGNLYGTTGIIDSSSIQPDRASTIFRITASGDFSTIARFGDSLGTGPTGIVEGSDGMLYGTTIFGSLGSLGTPNPVDPRRPTGFGVAFQLSTAGPASPIAPFLSPHPVRPSGTLVQVSGALYGTSCYGGLYGYGTVFRLGSGGVTTLHSFAWGNDGACPLAGLRLGPDGALYGSTYRGSSDGRFNYGTLFKITTSGEFTLLHSFVNPSSLPPGPEPVEGANPRGRLVFAPDGFAYGTTRDPGTMFRIAADGAFTVLHDFGVHAGQFPFPGLVLGTDGFFYGVGYYGRGLFRATSEGSVTFIHEEPDRDMRLNALTQASDGNLYGTSQAGGRFGAGFAFRATLAGAFDIIHDFQSPDGYAPDGDLFEQAGMIYGTTLGTSDGSRGFGTIYRMALDGTLTTLHRFNWIDGANSTAGLLRGTDGAFYGVTTAGGPGGSGVVFRLSTP